MSFSSNSVEYHNDIFDKISKYDLYFGDFKKNIILASDNENFILVHNEKAFSYYVMAQSAKKMCLRGVENNQSISKLDIDDLIFIFPLGVYTSYFSCKNFKKEQEKLESEKYFNQSFITEIRNEFYDKIFELEEEAENKRIESQTNKRIESQTSALINYCQKLNLYNNIDFFNNCILTSIRKFSLSFEPDTW